MNKKILYQEKVLYPEILWERPVHFYKAQAGKVLVLAGSKGTTGAAILTCEAVFRSGTGILVLGFPEKLRDIYKDILPEAMTLSLPGTPSISLAKKAEEPILEQGKTCNVAIIGPGLSTNAETIHLVWELLFKLEIPTVLDADGITALVKGIEVARANESEEFLIDYFKKLKAPLIITPNTGEMSRIINAAKLKELSKSDAKYVEDHKKDIAQLIAEKLGIVVVLKGLDSLIAKDGEIIINKTAGPQLTTAGTEDVLAGIVGSFVAQNPDKFFEATATAVYLHGLAGQIAKEKIGERSVIASDVIRYLPEAIKRAENND